MVMPILSACKVVIKRVLVPNIGSPERESDFHEPLLTKKYGPEVEVQGQVCDKRMKLRRQTQQGDEPEVKFYVVFTRKTLLAAKYASNNSVTKLIANTDSSLNLKPGDIIVSFEVFPGESVEVNATIDEFRPSAPDGIIEKQFLLYYAICHDDPEKGVGDGSGT